MTITQANAVDEVRIFWLVVLHVTFVVSGLLFALMDWVASLEIKKPGEETQGG
jgi:uncharacterized membrane protein YqhA